MTTFDPIRRPGLAYQHAFDWLAAHLHRSQGPVAALAPAPFHAGELLRRLPALALLPPLPPGWPDLSAAVAATPATAEMPPPGSLAAIAWAEPPNAGAGQIAQIAAWLRPGGRLYLLAPGRLHRFLAERRHGIAPPPLCAPQALPLLRQHGFRIRRQIGLHGPRAILWHTAGQAANRARLPALSDRAHFAMRRDFVETGPGCRLSALVLIAAERGARA